MAPMKRPASKASAQNTKKTRTDVLAPVFAAKSSAKTPKKQKDVLAAKCAAVADLIHEAEGYPSDVVKMLSSCAKQTLLVPKESRHFSQNQIIEMVREALASVEESSSESVKELEGKLANADSERQTREANDESANADILEKTHALEKAKEAEQQAVKAVSQAKDAVANAERSQAEYKATRAKAASRKKRLEAMWYGGDYCKLRQGQNDQQLLNRFMRVAKEVKFEKNMINTAGQILMTPTTSRSNFEELVLRQLDDQIVAAIQQESDLILNGNAKEEDGQAGIEDAKKQYEDSVEFKKVKSQEVTSCTRALQEAQKWKTVTEKSLNELANEIQTARFDAATAKEKHNSVTTVISTFQGLVDGTLHADKEAETSIWEQQTNEGEHSSAERADWSTYTNSGYNGNYGETYWSQHEV